MIAAKKKNLVPIHQVFDIQHGNKLDKNKMHEIAFRSKAIAFVGRSGENNGVVGYVAPVRDKEPYAAGMITVALGGAALSSFVQPHRFYTAQNIDVLDPLTEMTLDEKLYYCLCIEANRFKYSTFGREANRTLRDILVPHPDTLPSWTDGATVRAVGDLNRDLLTVIG